MIYKPSRINSMLAELPENLQIEALLVIKKEHDRLTRGDYTDEEKEIFAMAAGIGAAARNTIDDLQLRILTQ